MVSFEYPLWNMYLLPQYNCSVVMPPGPAWSESRGTPRPRIGIWSLFFGTTCVILYIPCILALRAHIGTSCYKIMFFLSVTDMIALYVNSLSFGVQMIRGMVFCSAPVYNTITGALGLGVWCTACAGCLLLVCNRLLELLDKGRYFEGRRTLFILFFPLLYGLYFILFTPPVLFNSTRLALFFTPFIFEDNFQEYVNWPHTVNNMVVVISSSGMYIALCVILVTKQGAMSSEQGRAKTVANAPIFIQAAAICFFNLVAAMIYVFMNFFPSPPEVVTIGHIAWQLSHGVPPFIYITLNRTIRRYILRLLRFRTDNKNKITTIPVSSWTARTI